MTVLRCNYLKKKSMATYTALMYKYTLPKRMYILSPLYEDTHYEIM